MGNVVDSIMGNICLKSFWIWPAVKEMLCAFQKRLSHFDL